MQTPLSAAVLALLLVLPLAGCRDQADEGTPATDGEIGHDHAGEDLYQCSMHPNVVSDDPGVCPICAMDLQPVKKIDAEGIPGRAPVQLTGQQKQLINIRTVPVKSEEVDQIIRARGVVRHDSSKVFTISAWTSGRINRLYVSEEEMFVSEGEMLYGIYSPELFSTLENYRLLQKRNADSSLLDSARNRLRQHGLTDEIIEGLETADDAPMTLDVPSPVPGLVMEKNVRLGDYVKEGDSLYTIVDLSELWLIIEVYESEIPFIKPGQEVTATTSAVPGKVFTGVVELVYHHINPDTRTAQVRVVFEDASQYVEAVTGSDGEVRHQHLLLPDMWMNAEIQRSLGEVLVAPSSAVFNTGRQQYLFVEQSEGVFVPTLVDLGPTVGERQVIRDGVMPGDQIVIDGNFLLDSESQLKAAASGPMDEAPDEETRETYPLPEMASVPVKQFIDSYEILASLLTEDKLEGIEPAAEEMREALTHLRAREMMPDEATEDYLEKLDVLESKIEVPGPPDLESAREQFGEISAAMIDLFKSFPPPLEEPLQLVNCPMWTKSPGDWLQSGEEIENPFMGQKMLRCGSVVSTIQGASK